MPEPLSALRKLYGAARQGLSELGGIKVYHSSPYDIERFDPSKIGTGQGAASYGYGHYFAENPKVSGQGGEYWDEFSRRFKGPELEAAQILRNNNFDRASAINEVEGLVQHYDDKHSRDILKLLESSQPVGPRTYEVELKADPVSYLDWDKPLRQQTHVQDALAEAMLAQEPSRGIRTLRRVNEEVDFLGDKSGDTLYRKFSTKPREASQMLQEAGIPGIKYLDQGSRAANVVDSRNLSVLERHNFDVPSAVDEIMLGYHESPKAKEAYRAQLMQTLRRPTSNYVMFPGTEDRISILKKYGVAGAPAGALPFGYDPQQQGQ